MTIQFSCIQCDKTIETPDDSAGKKCRCPDCGQVMPIPGSERPMGQFFVDPKDYPQKPAADPSNPYAAPPSSSMPYDHPPGMATEGPDRSVLVLIMGITSIITSFFSCGCCLLFFPVGLGLGIPAWTMANKDIKEIHQGLRNPSQRGMLQAGMICGIVGVSVATLFTILRLAMMMFQFGAIGLHEFGI